MNEPEGWGVCACVCACVCGGGGGEGGGNQLIEPREAGWMENDKDTERQENLYEMTTPNFHIVTSASLKTTI